MFAELTFDNDPLLFVLALLGIVAVAIWIFRAVR